MATRSTKLIIKNNSVPSAPFSGATLLRGEAIVNTADGIMMFSGVTSSTSEWTPAGTGGNSNFFEVGSNLYDLRVRNKITHYNDLTNLSGKFLSGTTSGFELANISDITGVDTFVTGSTLIAASNNTNTQSAQLTYNIPVAGGPYFISTQNTFTTGGTYNSGTTSIDFDKNDGTTFSVDLSNIDVNDTFVTGGTNNSATVNTNSASIDLLYNQDVAPSTYNLPYTDTFTTGGTYNNGTSLITFDQNDGSNFTVDLSTIDVNDTFVTGFTYNSTNNTFTISRNEGEPDLTASIDTVSGLTISNLTAGRVVYVGTGGELTDESGFEYNDTTNLLTVGDLNVTNASGTTATIGQGGLVIGSGGSTSTSGIGDLTVHGDLTVFGDTTTISTSELYVEDPQITLNYNPTGDTSTTSIASGLRIQDGDGSGNDVFYTVAQMNTFTGGDVTEYTGANGYTNRAFLTQLNDIVIRNTNSNNGAPDGARVLAEGDVLDGGTY
jgi:hypothetical protein